MASDEVGEDEEESGEDTSTYHDADGRSSPTKEDPSMVTTEQAKSFASEISTIQTARKRNLMSTSLMVRDVATVLEIIRIKNWLFIYLDSSKEIYREFVLACQILVPYHSKVINCQAMTNL